MPATSVSLGDHIHTGDWLALWHVVSSRKDIHRAGHHQATQPSYRYLMASLQPHHAGQTEEVTQMLSIYVVHLQWEPLWYISMWWTDGRKEKQTCLSLVKGDGTRDVREKKNSLLWVPHITSWDHGEVSPCAATESHVWDPCYATAVLHVTTKDHGDAPVLVISLRSHGYPGVVLNWPTVTGYCAVESWPNFGNIGFTWAGLCSWPCCLGLRWAFSRVVAWEC